MSSYSFRTDSSSVVGFSTGMGWKWVGACAHSLHLRIPSPHPGRANSKNNKGLLPTAAEGTMVDLAFWHDCFEQDQSWDDFGTTISEI